MHTAPLQTTHQDAITSLQSEVQQAAAAQEGLQEQLAQHAATVQEQLQQLEELNANITDLQGQLGECARTCSNRLLTAQHTRAWPVKLGKMLFCSSLTRCVTPCADLAGESQACAAAAKERIEVLEQEAEQAAAEQQAAAEAAAQALTEAQASAAKDLQAAQEAAAAELQQAQEQQEGERKKLQAELEAVRVRFARGAHARRC